MAIVGTTVSLVKLTVFEFVEFPATSEIEACRLNAPSATPEKSKFVEKFVPSQVAVPTPLEKVTVRVASEQVPETVKLASLEELTKSPLVGVTIATAGASVSLVKLTVLKHQHC